MGVVTSSYGYGYGLVDQCEAFYRLATVANASAVMPTSASSL